jgi:hypothetical protein
MAGGRSSRFRSGGVKVPKRNFIHSKISQTMHLNYPRFDTIEIEGKKKEAEPQQIKADAAKAAFSFSP